jgi:hypothetical protein
MPPTEVRFFQDAPGRSIVAEWFRELHRKDEPAYARCVAAVRRLAAEGHALRRPTAAYLRDKIYELRARRGRVHYRVLYSLHGGGVAVLLHGLTKEGAIPDAEIERAVERRKRYEEDPKKHTYVTEVA